MTYSVHRVLERMLGKLPGPLVIHDCWEREICKQLLTNVSMLGEEATDFCQEGRNEEEGPPFGGVLQHR